MQTESIFNRLVLPAWRNRTIHEVRRRDVIDLLEHIADERGGYMANRTLGVLSKFFSWLCARDAIEVSPVVGVERPFQELARKRTLSDSELKVLWLACEGDGPFGQALRLLALTGARRAEVSRLCWSEIDADRRAWILPSERSKNGREHAIPLSSQAWKIVQAMPRFSGCGFVFTADGRGPIVGWAKAKTRLSAKAGIPEEIWRLHDVRRCVAAGMQKLGTPVAVVEKALNHTSGTFRGIVGVYQTHDYADEIRVALQRWADRVDDLVSDRPRRPNVTRLHAGARR
jgi:integrase